jgi:site-specific DNA-cytosine methylase
LSSCVTHARQDEATRTFTNCVRTIKALRPKGVILENVVGLIKTGCVNEVKTALGHIPGYVLQVIHLNSADFGVPQHRARIYIIMLRLDALRGSPDACQELITNIVERCKDKKQVDFPSWLAARGFPITRVGSTGSAEPVVCNGCGINKSCEKHVRQCLECKTHNPSKKMQVEGLHEVVHSLSGRAQEDPELLDPMEVHQKGHQVEETTFLLRDGQQEEDERGGHLSSRTVSA